uniref:Uncharacterized protein n=1 Tax=Rhizophora mucronata TaxID=61149 RepID=A0A2P2NZS4_RHIMU
MDPSRSCCQKTILQSTGKPH